MVSLIICPRVHIRHKETNRKFSLTVPLICPLLSVPTIWQMLTNYVLMRLTTKGYIFFILHEPMQLMLDKKNVPFLWNRVSVRRWQFNFRFLTNWGRELVHISTCRPYNMTVSSLSASEQPFTLLTVVFGKQADHQPCTATTKIKIY